MGGGIKGVYVGGPSKAPVQDVGRGGIKLRKVGRRANGRWGMIVNARAFLRLSTLASGGQR